MGLATIDLSQVSQPSTLPAQNPKPAPASPEEGDSFASAMKSARYETERRHRHDALRAKGKGAVTAAIIARKKPEQGKSKPSADSKMPAKRSLPNTRPTEAKQTIKAKPAKAQQTHPGLRIDHEPDTEPKASPKHVSQHVKTNEIDEAQDHEKSKPTTDVVKPAESLTSKPEEAARPAAAPRPVVAGQDSLQQGSDGNTQPGNEESKPMQAAIHAVQPTAANPTDVDPVDGDASVDDATTAADGSVGNSTDAAPSFSQFLATVAQADAGQPQHAVKLQPAAFPPPPPSVRSPDEDFGDRNHPSIVSGVRGQLLPSGGTMHIRLEPPELGDMQVTVHVQDGVVSAAFQTSTDQATRLLSHSLGQLKSVLQSAGVAVDKLHVSQSPRESSHHGSGDGSQSRDSAGGDDTARRERQRRELLQRMWKKLSGSDPLDMVA